jgi:predicted nucleotidyltransferase
MIDERLDLIDAAVYADLFDCGVTEEELWRYSRVALDWGEFRRRLAEDPLLPAVLYRRDGLYCLAGRESLLEPRAQRRRQARKLQARARLVARVLQHAPFVRGLLLTGSAAVDDAGPDADVDLLVLVRHGRLSIVFTVLGTLSRLLSRKLFCPNYYLSDAHLTLNRRDPYLARELVQAVPLAGQAHALHAVNDWACSLFPNASRSPSPVRAAPGGALLQRILEWPLRGRLGDSLERFLRPLALSRLAEHHAFWGSSVPDDVLADLNAGIQLRFHGQHANQPLLARYEARRREIAARLERSY